MGTSNSKKEPKNNSDQFENAKFLVKTNQDLSVQNNLTTKLDILSEQDKKKSSADDHRKWTDQEKTKLIALYRQIQKDSDLYVDLDTLRKNKSSAIGRKKPKYVDRNLRIFSNNKLNFDKSTRIINSISSNSSLVTSPDSELNSSFDLRGSIISYVEGDIEFHDLMTATVKVFETETSENSRNHHVPIQLLDLYQTIRPIEKNLPLSIPNQKNRLKIPLEKEKGKRHKSRALIRPIDRQIVATQKDRDDPIPSSTRKIVWASEFKNTRKPYCYCCHCPLDYSKWHCGHILSRKEGGRIKKENLHPVCVGCNLGMGVNHMYEYILVNQLPGMSSLDYKDPIVIMLQQISILIHCSWAKIEALKDSGYITNTEAKRYREMIVSSKKTLSERIAIMVNLKQYEMRIPSLLNN
uniref:HNH endonuclease n=1 Tax=Pithovirus LCPAC201 TaxID=2506591 RepID=A0A481Z6V2_9VIRU|nr:MAG: HNH endonuclease [Pithovirus LCPAC201]